MPAEYDFYKNPIPPGSKRKPRLHARIVTNGTISTEELAEEIHGRSTLTTADIHATLISLSKMITEHLRRGDRVHINGLGYLQMTLQCPPVKYPKEIRGGTFQVGSLPTGDSLEGCTENNPLRTHHTEKSFCQLFRNRSGQPADRIFSRSSIHQPGKISGSVLLHQRNGQSQTGQTGAGRETQKGRVIPFSGVRTGSRELQKITKVKR